MIESIKMPVIVGDDEKDLEFQNDGGDIVVMIFDGKHICAFDYDNNFLIAMKRMIEIWGDTDDSNTI